KAIEQGLLRRGLLIHGPGWRSRFGDLRAILFLRRRGPSESPLAAENQRPAGVIERFAVEHRAGLDDRLRELFAIVDARELAGGLDRSFGRRHAMSANRLSAMNHALKVAADREHQLDDRIERRDHRKARIGEHPAARALVEVLELVL